MIDHTKCILVEAPNGSLSIILPAPKDALEKVLGPLTQEAYETHIIERNGLTDYSVVDASALPEDRTFRNAWKHTGVGVVDVDMEKAKAIQVNRWRDARNPLFEALDTEFMRAIETKDTNAQHRISQQKQALRDVTITDMSHIDTPEALKAFWPDILKEKK